MHLLVEAAHEGNGFQIFAATVAVGYPLAWFAGEVEVDHGGNGIDAEAVYVVFVEPEEGVADEELADFVTAVIKNERAPVGVLAL